MNKSLKRGLQLLVLFQSQPHCFSLEGIALRRRPSRGRTVRGHNSGRDLNTETDVDVEPIIVPLQPFQVTVEGSAVQDEDVERIMEEYLFDRLAGYFPPLAAVLLAGEDQEAGGSRKLALQHSSYFSAGAGIFLDPETAPTTESFQSMQSVVLEDTLSMQSFVNTAGYFWIMKGAEIGEQVPVEEEQVASSEASEDLSINALQQGSAAVEERSYNFVYISIGMLTLGLSLLILGFVLARRDNTGNRAANDKPRQLKAKIHESKFQEPIEIDNMSDFDFDNHEPIGFKIDMCGNIDRTVASSSSPSGSGRSGRQELASQEMDIVISEIRFGGSMHEVGRSLYSPGA